GSAKRVLDLGRSGDYRTAGSECKAAAAGAGPARCSPAREGGTMAHQQGATSRGPASHHRDPPSWPMTTTTPRPLPPRSTRAAAGGRFGRGGGAGHPGPLAAFLPSEDAPPHLPTLEELVHIEIEFAWQAWGRAAAAAGPGAPRRPLPVGDYLARFPRLNRPGV